MKILTLYLLLIGGTPFPADLGGTGFVFESRTACLVVAAELLKERRRAQCVLLTAVDRGE